MDFRGLLADGKWWERRSVPQMDYCWKRRGAEVSTKGPMNETMLEDTMNSEDYQRMHDERNEMTPW